MLLVAGISAFLLLAVGTTETLGAELESTKGPTTRAGGSQLSFALPSPIREGLVELTSGGSELTAVVFLGTECPMARSYASRLSELAVEYSSRGVRFLAVFSNRQDSMEDLRGFASELNVEFECVLDEGNVVADRYGATRTPEVFLLDRALVLRYRGRIDDQYAPGVARNAATREDLRLAIEELLAGKPVSVKQTQALGCIIGKIKSSTTVKNDTAGVTYSGQIEEMLSRNCVECHRSGEIGPFSMDSYDEVVGWADTMLEVVENGRMPPWHADPTVGEFANERLMPEQDKQLLRDWISQGLPEGESDGDRVSREFLPEWQLPRKPDLVVPMRSEPFVVPKDGVVEYQYFVADLNLEEDKWVSAVQVIPGNRSVVHHAIVFVRPPDGSQFRGIGWLGAYVPGQRFYPYPEGTARRIPAGSKLVFQMHYTPIGTVEEDITRVGLIFEDEKAITDEVFTLLALNQEFEIPPQAERHSVKASVRGLPKDGRLLAITPHMHYRGKAIELFVRQDEQVEAILNVPNYDFNWQHTYILKKPISLDEVDDLNFVATFDNSDSNPFNPDPSQYVTWGDQTWEEMAVSFFEVSKSLRSPELDGSEAIAGSRSAAEEQNAAKETEALEREKKLAREKRIADYVRRAFEQLDTNGDGRIVLSETGVLMRRFKRFDIWDANHDEVITEEELRTYAERLYR